MKKNSQETGLLTSIHVLGKKLYYWDNGQDSDVCVLMLHGLGGNHEGLLPIAQHITCRVVIPDLPGYGLSDELEEHSLENYTESLFALCKQLSLNNVIVFGHSLGSAIALMLAKELQENAKGTILLNPVPKLKKAMQLTLKAMFKASVKISDKKTYAFIHGKPYDVATYAIHQSKPSMDYLKSYVRSQQANEYSVNAWRDSAKAVDACDQYVLARSLKIPVMVIHGKQDKMISDKTAEAFTNAFVHGEMRILKDTGHFSHMEASKEVAGLVNAFAQQIRSRFSLYPKD